MKPSTLRGYREILKNHLLPAFGNARIDQITEEKIASFQARLVDKVSAVRVNNIVNLLRYILRVCVRRKLIPDSPADNVNRLAERQTKIDPLTEEELAAVLRCMDKHYRSFYLALAWTGARPGELLALTFDDLDFNRNEIRISKGRVRGEEGLPKTESSNRIIPMLDIVQTELLALKGSNCRSLDGHVFTNKKGQPINRHMDRQWRTALKKAGVRHRPSYQLRHTFASLCLQRGIEPGWVARVLGHTNLETTFRNYGRFINNATQENERTLTKIADSFAVRLLFAWVYAWNMV